MQKQRHCSCCWQPLARPAHPPALALSGSSLQLLANNEKTHWVPAYVKEKRFHNWLENARDWVSEGGAPGGPRVQQGVVEWAEGSRRGAGRRPGLPVQARPRDCCWAALAGPGGSEPL